MNGRQKAAFLRKNGFTKSRMQLTRVGNTYRNDRGVSVTFAKGCPGGGNFMVLGSHHRYNSSLLHIGNTSEGAKESLRRLRAERGDVVPDPDAADFGSAAWMDELFKGIVRLNA